MKSIFLKSVITIIGTMVLAQPALTEDWTLEVTDANCEINAQVSLPGGTPVDPGFKIISCPLTKKVQNNTFDTIWVRVNGGPGIECVVTTTGAWGGATHVHTVTSGSGAHSINLNLPTDSNFSGYEKVTCLLASSSEMFGIRYVQK